jgi:uncharacterized Tic20 family protein
MTSFSPAERSGPGVSPHRDGDQAWAAVGYLGVPFVSVLAPLAVYVARARNSEYARAHARQALNLAVTLGLYNLCALILGGMLALDAIGVALLIALPATLALWLVTLAYLAKAATAASGGGYYQLPGWLCATIVRAKR